MKQEDIIELMRIAYLAGHQDTVDGCVQWCEKGSKEVAKEIYETEILNNLKSDPISRK